jgi:2'-5' RNA ligase
MNAGARLFFALPIPEALQSAFAVERKRLEPLMAAAGARPRWALASQLHVTSKFLGVVGKEHIAMLRDAGARATRRPALTTTLGGLAAFGRRKTATVLFVPVMDADGFAALAATLEHEAVAALVPSETRPYVPHVTVVRFRDAVDPTPFIDGRPLAATPVTFERLRLYESTVTDDGGRYRVIDEWRLGE